MFIDNLVKKPIVIICTETQNLRHPQYYQLQDYKMFYNESKINKADGVVLYVLNNTYENTKREVVDRLRVVSSHLKLITGESLTVFAMYRCHDLPKTEFVNCVNKFLGSHSITRNHCIFGYFNIDILEYYVQNLILSERIINQEHLNNFFEHEYLPYFRKITRPFSDNVTGTCIDNCFAKTNNIELISYKLNVPFNDHYPLLLSVDQFKSTIENTNSEHYTNFKKLRAIANYVDWNHKLTIKDTNNAMEELINMIHSCLEKATCYKQKSGKNKDFYPRKKWISRVILVSC